MARGGRVGFETVNWFNGGQFDDDATLPSERSDIDAVLAASNLDWPEVGPSILGTLFERGLDRRKRAELGAHYTDRVQDHADRRALALAGNRAAARHGMLPRWTCSHAFGLLRST